MGTPRSRSRRTAAGATLLVALGLVAACASAASARYLYVGEFGGGATEVSALSVNASSGALTLVSGSPFFSAAARNLAISPDGRYLYGESNTGTGLAVFRIDGSSGQISEVTGSPFAAGSLPGAVAASADGRFVYVNNQQSDNLSGYTVDGSTGTLTSIGGTPIAAGDLPAGIALTPDGRYLYVANFGVIDAGPDSISAYAIDQVTGEPTPLSGSPFVTGMDAAGMAVEPQGRYLYVANGGTTDAISVYSISTTTGQLTPVAGSPFAAGSNPSSLAISPSGRFLYAGNSSGSNVSAYEIGASGQLTQLPGSPFGGASFPEQAAITPDGRFLYFPRQLTSNVSGFSVSSSTGQLTPLSGSPFATSITGLVGGNAIVPDQPPVATFAASAGQPGATTTFDASGSSDPDGSIASYDWDFGDGTTAANAGPAPSHTYGQAGTYTVALTLTDNEGCSTSLIYTGQTALCNGGSRAQATQQVQVASPADQPAPELKVVGKKRQKLSKRQGISVDVTCLLAACTTDVTARVGLPRSKNGRAQSAKRGKAKTVSLRAGRTQSIAAGETTRVRIRYTNRAFKLLRRTLRRRKNLRARVTASLVGAGQGTTAKLTVKLVSPKKKRRGRS